MRTAIRVKNLTKTFQSQSGGRRQLVKALDDVSLDVFEGETLGIVGPNGAGKTTFLNSLSTLIVPDSGTIEILGIKSVARNYNRLRTFLNMSSGYPNFLWSLTVEENLRFYGRLYGLSQERLNKRVAQLIEMFSLGEYGRRRFDELSSGTKQRLALAKALLNEPKILFLDEPTVGLDPDVALKTRQVITKIIKDLKVTVLLTTHYMREAESMCERVAFIKAGKILRLASPEELKTVHHKKDLEEVFIELAQRKEDTRAPAEDLTLGAGAVGARALGTSEMASAPAASTNNAILGWLNRALAFTYRNFLFGIRNLFSFMELLFWPIVSILSIGLLGGYLKLGEEAFAFVMTGAIAAGILQVTQLDVAYSLLYEVWSKSMKHTFLAPVGVVENLFGSWVVGIFRGLIIFFVLGLAARIMFGYHFPPFVPTAIFLAGIFCSALLLGLLVSILILMYGQKAEITAWMFAYVFMLLCGIYYPVNTLPSFFYHLAQWIPITYFLEYFRQSFGFSLSFSAPLAKGFGLVILYTALGIFAMHRAFHEARRKGTIVRLSE